MKELLPLYINDIENPLKKSIAVYPNNNLALKASTNKYSLQSAHVPTLSVTLNQRCQG